MIRMTDGLYVVFMSGFIAACSVPPAVTNPKPVSNIESIGFSAPPSIAGNIQHYQAITEPGVPVGLGFAIDLNNEVGIPTRCLDGKTETISYQQGSLFIGGEFNQEELSKIIGARGDAGIDFSRWGISSRGQFSDKTLEEKFGLNYLAIAINRDHSKVFIPDGRSEAMKYLSSEEFIARCGTGYVAAQDFGSLLIIRFHLKLDQKITDSAFGNETKGGFFSIAKLRAAISSNRGDKGVSGQLSLSALQVGGKPAELGKLLKTPSGQGLIESFPLCDVKEVETCLEGLRAIEYYMSEVFPQQIADADAGGSSVLATYPFRYPKTMGSEHNQGVDEYVMKARKDLTQLYEEEMTEVAELARFASESDQFAQKIMAEARANISDIRSTTQLCYDVATYKACVEKAEELAIRCRTTNIPAHVKAAAGGSANIGTSTDE